MPTSDERFTAYVAMRNTELQMLWTRFNLHLVLNSGFLFAYFSSDAVKSVAPAPQLFGLAFVALWLLSERAGRRNLKHFDNRIGNLELEHCGRKAIRCKSFSEGCSVLCKGPHFLRCQAWVSVALIGLFASVWIFLLCQPVTFRSSAQQITPADVSAVPSFRQSRG